MILTTVEAMRVVKAICDDERQKPREEQSSAIAREARLCADVLILKSQCEKASQNGIRGKP